MKNLKLIGGLSAIALMGITNVYAKDCSYLQEQINLQKQNGGTEIQVTESCEGGSLNIPSFPSFEFDLNGQTIKVSSIKMEGRVHMRDSKKTGKIIGTNTGSTSLITVKGELDYNDITLKSNGYGILADGGSITVNSGSITARLAALAGNNTLGEMFYSVNGGTLTSEEGPAVYLPGPIGFSMEGGTINGGLLFRMGTININGGTINGLVNKDKIDDLKTYYNYNGYVNYPDALAIIGGTYTTHLEGKTNDLELNITGGTFNSTFGNAVAIYDYGKVAQNMKVNINGGSFSTSAPDKKAYDELNLMAIGVTNPAEGYNKYTNEVKTTLTGGYYSNDVSKYLTDEYVQSNGTVIRKDGTIDDDNSYESTDDSTDTTITVTAPVIDTKEEVKDLTIGLDNVETAKQAFIKALEKLNINTENISVSVDVKNMNEDEIPEEEVKSMTETLKKREPNATLAGYFDITLNVLDTNSNNKLAELSELDNKIKFNIALPKDIKTVEQGYTRTYYVIRYHDNTSEIINANLNSDKTSVSFESDKFSSYALIYKDTKEETVVPKTFDGILGYALIGAVTLLTISGLVKYLKKNKLN